MIEEQQYDYFDESLYRELDTNVLDCVKDEDDFSQREFLKGGRDCS